MTPGDIIVIAVLAVILGLAIYSMRKKAKKGGGCTGNCSTCGMCHSQSCASDK